MISSGNLISKYNFLKGKNPNFSWTVLTVQSVCHCQARCWYQQTLGSNWITDAGRYYGTSLKYYIKLLKGSTTSFEPSVSAFNFLFKMILRSDIKQAFGGSTFRRGFLKSHSHNQCLIQNKHKLTFILPIQIAN